MLSVNVQHACIRYLTPHGVQWSVKIHYMCPCGYISLYTTVLRRHLYLVELVFCSTLQAHRSNGSQTQLQTRGRGKGGECIYINHTKAPVPSDCVPCPTHGCLCCPGPPPGRRRTRRGLGRMCRGCCHEPPASGCHSYTAGRRPCRTRGPQCGVLVCRGTGWH